VVSFACPSWTTRARCDVPLFVMLICYDDGNGVSCCALVRVMVGRMNLDYLTNRCFVVACCFDAEVECESSVSVIRDDDDDDEERW
jgi:hypothetical protein